VHERSPRSSRGRGIGEVLTGPNKPRPFDHGNRLWSARSCPVFLEARAARGGEGASPRRVGSERTAGDRRPLRAGPKRSTRRELANASALELHAGPVHGRPQKTRLEIDADGGHPVRRAAAARRSIWPAAGAWRRDVLAPPRPAIRVALRGSEASVASVPFPPDGDAAAPWPTPRCRNRAATGLDAAAATARPRLLSPPRRASGPGHKDPERSRSTSTSRPASSHPTSLESLDPPPRDAARARGAVRPAHRRGWFRWRCAPPRLGCAARRPPR